MSRSNDDDRPDLPALVQAEQTLVRLPSRPHWIEPTVEYLRQKAILCGACEESRSSKLLLALQEALANAVIHGNLELSSELKERDDSSFAEALAQRAADPTLSSRLVEVLVEYDGRRCCWIITDQGKGFDVDAVMRRLESDDPEVLLASGRGILIMRSFLDGVKYQNDGRRLILTMNRDSGEEKRQQPRIETTQPLRITPIRGDGSVDWDAAYEAVSLNLSQKGMGLLQHRLATPQRILIGIYAGDQPLYVPAEVRHCRDLGGNVVELGCRFQTGSEVAATTARDLAEQPEAEETIHRAVADLLNKHQGPPLGADERRVHLRIAYNERIEIVRPETGETYIGFARDLSKGGVSFITTVLLPPAHVVLTLPQNEGKPLRIRAHVVRCNKVQERFYDVGARFLQLE
jgi:anti-sigma regulatory factor (Ser/Thr protein kinase)